MNTPNADSDVGADSNRESRRPLRTEDLAAATNARDASGRERAPVAESRDSAREPRATTRGARATSEASATEGLEALFPPETAAQFRKRWADVQNSFVDDPRRAVGNGDELVAEVMKSLAESFASERKRLENDLSHTDEASTETLRLGLRRYRSFFERLLAL